MNIFLPSQLVMGETARQIIIKLEEKGLELDNSLDFLNDHEDILLRVRNFSKKILEEVYESFDEDSDFSKLNMGLIENHDKLKDTKENISFLTPPFEKQYNEVISRDENNKILDELVEDIYSLIIDN